MDRLEEICQNSYRNFHVKGFDYLCLERSPNFTHKAYFFGENLENLPELVMPHDHRYSFDTTVVRGRLSNLVYRKVHEADSRAEDLTYDHFSYMTPLNGGDGFTWKGEVRLRQLLNGNYGRRQSYSSLHTEVHTLKIRQPGTIIVLRQYEDNVPLDAPSNAYRLGGSREPPNLDGLYDKMDADHAVKLLVTLAEAGI